MLTVRTWVLLIVAALLIAAGTLNFLQRLKHKSPPTDGVLWSQTNSGVAAESVQPDSPAGRAGILPGDILVGVSEDEKQFDEVTETWQVPVFLEEAGVGGHLVYRIYRPSFPEETRTYDADLYDLQSIPDWTSRDLYINIIGLIYLFVGFFVLFKQGGRAPFVLHFATLCLVAFVFHFYRPIGTGEDLDAAIDVLDNAALALFAPIFVHFCALYPARYHLSEKRRWPAILLYAPALVLIALTAMLYTREYIPVPLRLPDSFYRWTPLTVYTQFAMALVVGAGLIIHRFIKTETAVVRQQLKWVVWGSALAIAPFTILYSIPFAYSTDLEWLTDIAILPLALIPLTFGNSVVRYRLMDVDMVVRRAAGYALSTLAIALMIGVVVYAAGVYALGDAYTPGEITLRVIIAVGAMAVIVMIAAPIKNFIQERIDRFFYGERYDLRHGLLDFGRTLSATTALEPLLDALVSRLQQVLGVERVAIFIEDKRDTAGYRVARAVGLSPTMIVPPDFREMIRTRSAETGVVRADDLDLVPQTAGFVRRALHYYVPCVVRGRMVAVIGLGRSADGALLSSEDVEILRTVSGYVAVAIENSLLYQEQKERAAELELLKEFNESIVESINVGLLAVDLEGRITRCNSALEEVLGINRDEAVGHFVEDLFAEDFGETLSQVLGQARWHTAELRRIYKLHTATSKGRSLVLNIAIAPLEADSQGRTGSIVVLEDVTTRMRLEEQLQQREKLSSIGLLAAGVAHEVNTPLTGVSSYTQMLLGMLPETDPKHALLQKVRRQADRASNIVNNLLNFSRTGSATEFAEVDVHRVLDDTLQLLEPQLRRSQIEIEREYQEELPHVYGNAGKLQQVFTNLLLNARDAIPEGGRITLKTSLADSDVQIEVIDTGIGIAPENIAKIYDPFFTTKGVGRGTGLGLAVTYGIVQEHDGHIAVRSAPGHGTTFRITLPTMLARTRLQAAGD
ncbi:MAG: PAS domain S-box protein [Pyrinomonadaceae bacterium]|nr:PAS domain S-box protein [Pyrinomonadaceae bacterium]